MNLRKSFSRVLMLVLFLILSLVAPWAVMAIVGGAVFSSVVETKNLPEEQPIRYGTPMSERERLNRLRGDNDWRTGARYQVAYAGEPEARKQYQLGVPVEIVPLIPQEEWDARSGVFANYRFHGDNTFIERQIATLGGFIFLSSHTRLQASGSGLYFDSRDTSASLDGTEGYLHLAQLLGRFMLQGGLGRHWWDGADDTWVGFVKGDATIKKLSLGLEFRQDDVWERIINIQDSLQLVTLSPYLYYQLLTHFWLTGYGSYGEYSDDNIRRVLGGDLGYFISREKGLSVSGGIDTYQFDETKPTYWSPDYYHYLFGRIRWTRNFEDPLFPLRTPFPENWRGRLGFLAAYTGGVADDEGYEQTLQAGLRYQILDSWSVKTDWTHFNSDIRFGGGYYENQFNLGTTVKFK